VSGEPIEAVLPLRRRARRGDDLERASSLLVPSLRKFLGAGTVRRLWVLAVPAELPEVRGALASSRELPIEVLSEDELCPSLAGWHGWRKQQVLKLAAAQWVETRCYLTLDADVLLTRPLAAADLFVDGRPIHQPSTFGMHWSWWKGSARVLGRGLDDVRREDPCIGVTPELLLREQVRALWRELERRHGQPWTEVLRHARGWTEYTLYWLHLMAQGSPERFHGAGARHLYGACHWSNGGARLSPGRVDEMFDPAADHLFSIVQSRARGIGVGDTVALVARYLR
jgi:hypothetical protein